jgi:hypothetical protein
MAALAIKEPPLVLKDKWETSCLVFLGLMASFAYGAPVEWNLDKRGRLKDSGCDSQAQDTFLIDDGEQFAVIFTRLHARLDEGDLRKGEAT